jgi:hypothetical protein
MVTIAALTKKTVDHSTKKQFAFSFFCDTCGKEWRSPKTPYKQGGFSDVRNEETKSLLWSEAHRVAFERANLEAQFHFNYCEECGSWVCDACFNAADATCLDCRAENEKK